MSLFEHGTTRIFFEQEGSGPPLLLLPGWAGNIGELAAIRQALVPTYTVIAADLPGSGKSGPQPRHYTPSYWEEDARSLAALIQHLGFGPAHVVGFSDGGECALFMAVIARDTVRSVVAWGAAGAIDSSPEMIDAFDTLVDDPIPDFKAYSEYMKATYGEDAARVMARSEAAAMRAVVERGGDICRSRADEIRCPVLLIAGSNDFIAPPALISTMAAAVPNGEFLEVAEAGHAVHRDQPDLLIATVSAWLAKV